MPGMNSLPEIAEARARDVRVVDDRLMVELTDGRTIIVPVGWYPRLLHASAEQRARWELIGTGTGIHWPDVDENLSVEGLLLGLPAPKSEFRRFGMEPPDLSRKSA